MIGIPTDLRWPLSALIVGTMARDKGTSAGAAGSQNVLCMSITSRAVFFYQASQTNVHFPCERSNVEEYVDGLQRDASA